MPKSNKELALEALDLVVQGAISLERAAADVTPAGYNGQSVLRAAQRILARVPRMDEAVERAYDEAAWNTPAAMAAVSIIDTIPARKRRPTWERVEWLSVDTQSGAVEGRVERRATDVRERNGKAPVIAYEWRVQEERPDVKRGWKTDACPTQALALAAFRAWAMRRAERRYRRSGSR